MDRSSRRPGTERPVARNRSAPSPELPPALQPEQEHGGLNAFRPGVLSDSVEVQRSARPLPELLPRLAAQLAQPKPVHSQLQLWLAVEQQLTRHPPTVHGRKRPPRSQESAPPRPESKTTSVAAEAKAFRPSPFPQLRDAAFSASRQLVS